MVLPPTKVLLDPLVLMAIRDVKVSRVAKVRMVMPLIRVSKVSLVGRVVRVGMVNRVAKDVKVLMV